MKAALPLLAALCLCAVLTQAQSEIVTLWATNNTTLPRLVVKSSQSAELLSWQPSGSADQPPRTSARIGIYRDGVFITEYGAAGNEMTAPPFRVAGPLELELRPAAYPVTFATFRLSPASEISPPSNTIVIPADTAGANIILEKSTDLSNWTAASPGVYTNAAPAHLFFRIRAERLPE